MRLDVGFDRKPLIEKKTTFKKTESFMSQYMPIISAATSLLVLFSLLKLKRATKKADVNKAEDLRMTSDLINTMVGLSGSIAAGYLAIQGLRIKKLEKELEEDNKGTLGNHNNW